MYHTMSIEDREMFAYNKRHNEIQHHLSQPENRIRYCYEFMNDAIEENDARFYANAFSKALYWLGQVEDEEAHF